MTCPTCRDVAAALAPRGPWPDATPGAALALVRAVLAQAEERPQDEVWADPTIHRVMLRDAPRTEAFRRALEAVVRPGDVVLDVGAGTGVLSAFAARAGAAEVHAVERSGLADALEQVVARNGLGGIVRVRRGDARALDLPRARVLVSEWLGDLVFRDAMWPAVVAARDRCLEPGGVVVPAAVELRLAPIEDAALREDGPGWWDAPRWGLDLGPLAGVEAARPRALVRQVAPAALLAPPASVTRVDCARDGADAERVERALGFDVARDGTLDAFAGWFLAELAPGVALDTGPDAPPTHWLQQVLPVRPTAVRRGQRLDVRLMLDGARRLELRAALDGREVAAAAYR